MERESKIVKDIFKFASKLKQPDSKCETQTNVANCYCDTKSTDKYIIFYSPTVEKSLGVRFSDMCFWSLYFDAGDTFESQWTKAKELYQEGKLQNVVKIMIFKNISQCKSGIPIFFCLGNKSDETFMLEVGCNIVKCMKYKLQKCSLSNYIFCKESKKHHLNQLYLTKIDISTRI